MAMAVAGAATPDVVTQRRRVSTNQPTNQQHRLKLAKQNKTTNPQTNTTSDPAGPRDIYQTTLLNACLDGTKKSRHLNTGLEAKPAPAQLGAGLCGLRFARTAPWQMVDIAPSASLPPTCHIRCAPMWRWRRVVRAGEGSVSLPHVMCVHAAGPSLVVVPRDVRN